MMIAIKNAVQISFPEGASNNDLARFLYYQGRIKAMQLDYTAASGYFLQVALNTVCLLFRLSNE